MTASCNHDDCIEHESAGLAMACLRDRTAYREFDDCVGCGSVAELVRYDVADLGNGAPQRCDEVWECWRCGQYGYSESDRAFVFESGATVTRSQYHEGVYPLADAPFPKRSMHR